MENANGETKATGRRCARCGVQFVDGPPPLPDAVSRGREAGDVEWLRCPDCGLRFWADPAGGADGRCTVGLYPEDAP